MDQAVVFGTGNYYRTKKESILSQYELIGFLDSAIKPDEEVETDGLPTVNPENIYRFPEVKILLMSVKYLEMWGKLMELNVDSSRIIIGLNFKPAYDPLEGELAECGFSVDAQKECLILHSNSSKHDTYSFRTEEEQQSCIRRILQVKKPEISTISSLPLQPVSRRYGREHGTPIDRHYIEQFLQENCDKIRGDVAEFADDSYTRKFGSNISRSYVLHVNGWGKNVIRANLVTGEGIRDDMVDCLICTQVLQFIYDLDSAVKNLCRMLKPGGVFIGNGTWNCTDFAL